MAAKGTRVAVATAATKLNTASTDSSAGSALLVRNRDASASVYIGASNVTTATGYELLAGESLPVDLDPGEDIYAICAASTVTCHVLEVGI